MTEPRNHNKEGPWADIDAAFPLSLPWAVLLVASCFLAQYGVAQLYEREHLTLPQGLPSTAPQLAVFVLGTLLLLIFWKFIRKAPMRGLGLRLDRLPGDLLFTLFAAVGMAALYGLIGLGVFLYFEFRPDELSAKERFLEFLTRAMFKDLSVTRLVMVVLLYPIVEEIWFRGLLYTPLRRERGRWLAIVLTALVFAFAHGNAFPINQFLGGLVFALAYEVRRTLVAPILLHILGNGALAVLGYALPEMSIV